MHRQFKRTRLAPTPSGFLHIGNVLSFSITASLAQKNGARILLRIDDMDRSRVNHRYLQDIFDTLNFLEIPWDEGPRSVNEFNQSFSQGHRTGLYHEALKQLEAANMVFACDCSRKGLSTAGPCLCAHKHIPLNAENIAWRFRTGDLEEITVKGYDGGAAQNSLPAEIQNFVVRKKDGFPAYQLTSVVDDLFYEVDLVIRGQDLWPSTLAQQALATALAQPRFKSIGFFHHALLNEASGNKLSKSAGATSIKNLRESGKSRAEVFGLIGEALGAAEKPYDWSELAALAVTD